MTEATDARGIANLTCARGNPKHVSNDCECLDPEIFKPDARGAPVDVDDVFSDWAKGQMAGFFYAPHLVFRAGWHARDAELDRLRQAKEEAERGEQAATLIATRERLERDALQRRLAALTEAGRLVIEGAGTQWQWIKANPVDYPGRERLHMSTTLGAIEALDKALDADAQEQGEEQ